MTLSLVYETADYLDKHQHLLYRPFKHKFGFAASADFSLAGQWGIRDCWKNGMCLPHHRLGWFPLSVKGGVIRYWTMKTPQDYFQYIGNGYQTEYDIGKAANCLPRRMHVCLICASFFDSTFHTTVSHCDSPTHRDRLTDILDLESLLPSGLSAPSSPEGDIADQLACIGVSSSDDFYDNIHAARGEVSVVSTVPTPAVDLSSLLSTSLHISDAQEVEYNKLLSAMRTMGMT